MFGNACSYEFDVGIHYIGEMREHCPGRILVDSISDGQIEWAELPDNYDLITIGYTASLTGICEPR